MYSFFNRIKHSFIPFMSSTIRNPFVDSFTSATTCRCKYITRLLWIGFSSLSLFQSLNKTKQHISNQHLGIISVHSLFFSFFCFVSILRMFVIYETLIFMFFSFNFFFFFSIANDFLFQGVVMCVARVYWLKRKNATIMFRIRDWKKKK